MRNLLNYESIVVSVKYTAKYLLRNIQVLVLENTMHFV